MRSLFALTLLLPGLAWAAPTDLLPVKQLGMELARDIATKSIEACRQDGYNVSAVVLDRAGNLQAALRDGLAARHTLEIAERCNLEMESGGFIFPGYDTPRGMSLDDTIREMSFEGLQKRMQQLSEEIMQTILQFVNSKLFVHIG